MLTVENHWLLNSMISSLIKGKKSLLSSWLNPGCGSFLEQMWTERVPRNWCPKQKLYPCNWILSLFNFSSPQWVPASIFSMAIIKRAFLKYFCNVVSTELAQRSIYTLAEFQLLNFCFRRLQRRGQSCEGFLSWAMMLNLPRGRPKRCKIKGSHFCKKSANSIFII